MGFIFNAMGFLLNYRILSCLEREKNENCILTPPPRTTHSLIPQPPTTTYTLHWWVGVYRMLFIMVLPTDPQKFGTRFFPSKQLRWLDYYSHNNVLKVYSNSFDNCVSPSISFRRPVGLQYNIYLNLIALKPKALHVHFCFTSTVSKKCKWKWQVSVCTLCAAVYTEEVVSREWVNVLRLYGVSCNLLD